MRPPRALTRSVRIAFAIGVLVVDAVRGDPEDRSAFEREGAAPGQEVLDPLVGLIAAMCQEAVIGHADAEHAGNAIQDRRGKDGADI